MMNYKNRGSMKKLGTVKNIIHDGTKPLEAHETSKPGTPIYDSRGRMVGKVARVFGPVNGPYVSVKPTGHFDALSIMNSSLYAGDSPVNKKKGVNTRQRRKRKPQRK